ncbi:hypothetical protein EV182_002021 [Spiromyces aspiralis]|uniref:Uncharacterized protein n=1 Tax=Spiromyces aspiralis TaxID=68401 RepID=A0ACC1HES5_9FUNG|nr:hypothetical protein EV182_002021 [Spiromyces aspiralis]
MSTLGSRLRGASFKTLEGVGNRLLPNRAPTVVDPHFEINEGGDSGLVHAKLPAYSQLYVTAGSLVARSSSVSQRVTTRETAVVALAKKLLLLLGSRRNILVQHVWTNKDPGEVILAAGEAPCQAQVITMSGASDYYVAPRSVIASTKFVSLSTWYGKGVRFDRVLGKGAVVVKGAQRLVLDEGQSFLVDPRYLIAFETSMLLKPLVPERERKPVFQIVNVLPASKERDSGDMSPSSPTSPASAGGEDGVKSRRQIRVDWQELYERAAGGVRRAVGRTELYRLVGPGEFYLSSKRRSPSMWQQLSFLTGRGGNA